MLTTDELQFVDSIEDLVIKGVILSMDNTLDIFQEVIGELEQRVRQLEKRLDNI